MTSTIKKPTNPINKSIKKSISHKTREKTKSNPNSFERNINNKKLGISVVVCTNRPGYLNNVFDNFINQKYEKKELIIILNDNKMRLKNWLAKANEYNYPIRVFQIDENKSLGFCLNFGVSKAIYEIIAKFDDDDYYSSNYLSESVKSFKYADVIGKATTFVYFEANKTLAIRSPKRDNRYVYRLEGPTLLFKKEISNIIKFADKSLGEDIQFCKDCAKNGIRMYSTDRYNYVYIRHSLTDKHAWKISDEFYMKLCKVVGITNDYKTPADSYKK
ncbi:glycosyltransferase [Brassicibacter mesophilus]|uniref:glycosyltransferase n=1 Tax=Brassicibacter mesophilus TaxID=745119 RepID=UPI003D2363C4